MSRAFIAPRKMLDAKPSHGQPCTRCGLCCYATLCVIGRAAFGHKTEPAAFGLGPCPALEFEADGLSACGLVDHPERHVPKLTATHGVELVRAAAKTIICPATGCDARFNGEPVDHDFNERMSRWDEEHASEIRRAKNLWGIE